MIADWSRKKVVVMSLLLVGSLGAMAYGIYHTWANTPPGLPATAEEALQTIGTTRYENLPDYRKREYLSQANRLVTALPPEERKALFDRISIDDNTRKAMGEMHRERIVSKALAFAAASPKDRIKMLDEEIDEMERMRAQFEAQRPPPGSDAGEKKGDVPKGPPGMRDMDKSKAKEFMQDRVQHGNPQVGALMAEYFRAVQQRRAQRGMSGPR